MEMKCCNCNYEYKDSYETENETQVGDERFIKIDCLGRPFETDHEKEYWDYSYHERYDKAYLYACPKCRNVILDSWE